MGYKFDEKGYMVMPEPKKDQGKDDRKCLLVKEAFCQNGHNLIWEDADFNGHGGIRLLVKDNHGNEGHVILSPIYGDTTKVTLGIKLKEGERVKLCCPHCSEELPTLKPCDWCEGGEIKTISLRKPFDYNQAIGLCDLVGCHNSVFYTAGELVTDDMLKYNPDNE